MPGEDEELWVIVGGTRVHVSWLPKEEEE